jgi:hypothetical protein
MVHSSESSTQDCKAQAAGATRYPRAAFLLVTYISTHRTRDTLKFAPPPPPHLTPFPHPYHSSRHRHLLCQRVVVPLTSGSRSVEDVTASILPRESSASNSWHVIKSTSASRSANDHEEKEEEGGQRCFGLRFDKLSASPRRGLPPSLPRFPRKPS